MKLLQSGGGKIAVEFSTSEFLKICDVVYTADAFYESLDPVPYKLDEAQVTAIAKALSDLCEGADFRP